MTMNTSSETDVDKEEKGVLCLDVSRILTKIHRKWQQSGCDEEVWLKRVTPFEEMDTVILPADSETVQQSLPVEDELTETVILTPVVFGKKTAAAEWSLDEVPETVIITPGSEDDLDETIILPPKQERLKRRGIR